MDKKPTLAILKNEIDKLKTSFEIEKQDKNDKINQILSVVDNLGKSLSAYSDADNGQCGHNEYERNGTDFGTDNEKYESMNTLVAQQMEERFKEFEKIVLKLRLEMEEEIRKKDADWQQKYDVMEHKLSYQINSLSNENKKEDKEDKKENGYEHKINAGSQDKPLIIKFAALTPHAQKPTRGSEQSAGIDLKSAYEYCVPAKGNKLIKTDWRIEYPEGYFGKICSRSGLSLNDNIEVGAGVCDADFLGNTSVILNNFSSREFRVAAGDRVAQLICTPYISPKIVYCSPDEISSTARGENGFGSTGIH